MKNWTFFVIEILIFLLMKVSKIQSGCKWDSDSNTSQKYCSITCETNDYFLLGFESVDKVMTALDDKWTKRPSCHVDGIVLKLEDFVFTKNIVAKNWFTAQVKVRELSISLNGRPIITGNTLVTKIEIDAFNENAFQLTKKLTFTSISLSSISKGIFNGFQSLEILHIKGAEKLNVIDLGVLDVLNQTLKEFSLEQSSKSVDEIFIDGFTSSEKLEKVEKVKFMYKLETSITIKSFKGLTNVRTLDLSECQIISIGGGAFDLLRSLELLNLRDNYIATISQDVFSFQLVSNITQILLKGNNWFCNCDLMPFKQSLMEYSNFVDELECYDPSKYKAHILLETDFCETITSSTSTTSLTSPIPPGQVCRSLEVPEVFAIEAPKHKNMEILENENGDVILQDDKIKESSVLIWFSLDVQKTYANSSNVINCLIGSGSSFRIENVVEDLVYTFCLMEPMKMTVSPLDCISYSKKSALYVWMTDNEKNRVIGITTAIYGLTTLIGLTIVIVHNKVKVLTNNRNENYIRRRKTSRSRSMRRNRHSVMSSDSYTTRRTSNTTVQYFIESNENAPPLPARPLSMFPSDEPIYATIRDVTTISTHSQLSVSYI